MAGAHLPIRLEAMRLECDRYPAAEELVWRISLIDGEFLNLQEEKRKQKTPHTGK